MKRSKVLVVSHIKEDFEWIEKALASFLAEGGEIFSTHDEQRGLQVLVQEKPRLLFLDEGCVHSHQEKWIQAETQTILLQEKEHQMSEDYLVRPLNLEKVFRKCQEAFPQLDAPPAIAM